MKVWVSIFLLFPLVIEFSKSEKAEKDKEIHKDKENNEEKPYPGLHPLDTITEEEIKVTMLLVRRATKKKMPKEKEETFFFSSVALKEPRKSDLLPFFLNGTEPPVGYVDRVIHACVFHRPTLRVFEATVDTTSGGQVAKLVSFDEMPFGLQPLVPLDEEGVHIPEMAMKDPAVRRRFEHLGVTNMSMVRGDAWFYVHNDEKAEYKGRRIAQVFFYVSNFEEDNRYTHPVPFIVIVNIRTGQVIDIQNLPIHEDKDTDNRKGESIPKAECQFDPDLVEPAFYRPPVKPIGVTQPEGVNYKAIGSLVLWQNWRFRISFASREGLILNTIGFTDKGKYHPLFYKVHLSELHLNYADPRPPFHRKIPFDVGHYGLGIRANFLHSPEDCRGESVFFDAIGLHGDGTIQHAKNAVCVFEEDAGFLWRKGHPHDPSVLSVRANRLGVKWITTSGNYDYEFTWQFYQDASMRMEVKLHGIVNPNVIAAPPPGKPWEPPKRHLYGTVIAPQLSGMYHQHIFAIRIDPNIDGELNNIFTVDLAADPPLKRVGEIDWANGWGPHASLLTTVEKGRTNCDLQKGRTWLISVPGKRHPISGTQMGYKLIPENLPPMYLRSDSPLHPLVEYGDYDMWVLPYDENQIYAAGYYVNNSGLGEWARKSMHTSIVEQDLVLWHVFRVSHVPRVEEFPIMPGEIAGFWLKPANFFLSNPSMDILPTKRN